MPAVKIPGAESIESVAPQRDPGVTASPDAFGAQIGASEAHFGDTLSSLGAHMYKKLQDQTTDTWVQTHNIDSSVAFTQAQYDNRAKYPQGDADGGTAAQDDLRRSLQQAQDTVTARTTARLGAPTAEALSRVNATLAGRAQDALVQGLTFGHNQQVIAKQTVLDDNVKLIGARVLSGDMPLDAALKTVDANVASGTPLYSASQLVDAKDKWQKAVVSSAIENKFRAGDVAGGLALRDKYFGAVPKSSGVVTELPGDIGRKIDEAAINAGLDPMVARRVAKIESGGDARASTGKYKGVFQLSDEGFAAHGGGGDIFNADQNIKAGIHSLKADSDAFRAQYGRDPSPTELYLSHQQGQAGLASQLAHPNAPAWQNMASTGEGKAKGEAWAKLAIWGNIPDAQKAQFGSVNNITGKQFVDLWRQKVEGGGGVSGSGNVKVASATGSGGDAGGEYDSGTRTTSKGGPEPELADPTLALHWEQQAKARTADLKQIDAKKQADIEKTSQAEQLVVFKDMHSDNPTMSPQDILNNKNLTEPAAMHMYNLKVAPKNNGDGYGTGYVDLFQRVHLPLGDPQRLSDPAAIYPMAKAGGPLTPAGAEKLVSMIDDKKTFEGSQRQAQISRFLEGAKQHITGQDLGFGIKDPQGEQQYASYLAAFDSALADELKKPNHKPLSELLSGDGPLFKLSENFRRDQTQWYSQLIKDNPNIATGGKSGASTFDIHSIKSLDDLKAAAKRGDVSNIQANRYAVSMGWASNGPVSRPAAPVSN